MVSADVQLTSFHGTTMYALMFSINGTSVDIQTRIGLLLKLQQLDKCWRWFFWCWQQSCKSSTFSGWHFLSSVLACTCTHSFKRKGAIPVTTGKGVGPFQIHAWDIGCYFENSNAAVADILYWRGKMSTRTFQLFKSAQGKRVKQKEFFFLKNPKMPHVPHSVVWIRRTVDLIKCSALCLLQASHYSTNTINNNYYVASVASAVHVELRVAKNELVKWHRYS